MSARRMHSRLVSATDWSAAPAPATQPPPATDLHVDAASAARTSPASINKRFTDRLQNEHYEKRATFVEARLRELPHSLLIATFVIQFDNGSASVRAYISMLYDCRS